jgi:hypothetical protein
VDQRTRASIQAALNFRKKLPIRKRLGDHGIVSRLWDRHDVFAIQRRWRYHETEIVPQFKPLLTLLELIGFNLHDVFPGVGR